MVGWRRSAAVITTGCFGRGAIIIGAEGNGGVRVTTILGRSDAYDYSLRLCYASRPVRNSLHLNVKVDGLHKTSSHGPCYA